MFKRSINDFNLKNTFLNGQCFRFDPYKNGFLGIAKGKVIYLEEDNGVFSIDGVSEEEFDGIFLEYFDLKRDYQEICKNFQTEENLEKAIEYGRGMKILKQDLWETLISFIISQNNNIGRIKSIIARLSMNYGTPVAYDNTVFYLFPTAEQLKDVKKEDYMKLGCGYRADYLEATVKEWLINKPDFAGLSYSEAREKILSFKGVGPKVANCILLFGLNYLNAFPVDTWIKKVMEGLYLKRSASNSEIEDFAKEAFKEYAGIAQQYLFYYARENKIKGID